MCKGMCKCVCVCKYLLFVRRIQGEKTLFTMRMLADCRVKTGKCQ